MPVSTTKPQWRFSFDHSNYVKANLIYQWTPSFRMVSNISTEPTKFAMGIYDGQRLNFVIKYDLE